MRREFAQGAFRITAQNQIKQIQNSPPIRQAQHRADLVGSGLPGTVGNGLIEQRLRITRRSFGGACDETERLLGDLSTLCRRNSLQHRDHDIRLNAPQIKPLAARQDRHRDFTNFCCGEDKFHMGGWLF